MTPHMIQSNMVKWDMIPSLISQSNMAISGSYNGYHPMKIIWYTMLHINPIENHISSYVAEAKDASAEASMSGEFSENWDIVGE